MEQQQDQLQQWASVPILPLQNQPPRPASTQPTVGESATPTTGQADRSSSTPPQNSAVLPQPPANAVSPAKNQDHRCHKCLVLYLQKIDSAPAVAVTKKCVTKK